MTEKQCGEAQRAGIVPRVAESSAVALHPLVGTGVHFKDQYGRVQDRAAIVAVIPSNNAAVGDLVLLQYFGRLRTEPPTQRLIPLAELSGSERWVLYRSVAEMIWSTLLRRAARATPCRSRRGARQQRQRCGLRHRSGSCADGADTPSAKSREHRIPTRISCFAHLSG